MISLLVSAAFFAAATDPTPPARFALVVGVGQAVDDDLPPLKFADDDAAAYARLFATLGMPTVVVTHFDDDTRRLYPKLADTALPPTRAGLTQALEQIRQNIVAALERGEEAELFFAYAGHGSVKGGLGYITLEDGRLTGQDLEREIVGGLGAARTHLIIDACYSVFLAYHRGAGGERRPAAGFSEVRGLLQNPRVGLLLSTSATNLTHEWERFGAGVFSHLVRSGLYGAADANGDRWVDYKEIAAFVSRATESISNRKYRPSVFAKPPAAAGRLSWLGDESTDRLIVGPPLEGRFLLEDARGVRLLDFHNASTTVELVRPRTDTALFLRHADQAWEMELPAVRGRVEASELPRRSKTIASRGAAEAAMDELLALPFNAGAVQTYDFPSTAALLSLEVPPDPVPTWRLVTGWSSVALSVVAAGVGAAFSVSALDVRDGVPLGASHVDVLIANGQINELNGRALALYGVSVGALAAGLALLLWPADAPATGLTEAPAP